jgi:hypothetical protein
MASKFVDGFKPSVQGFQFENDFEDGPVLTVSVPVIGDIPVGNANGGLCGGMGFGVPLRSLNLAIAKSPSLKSPFCLSESLFLGGWRR